jgi:hypothetical protein
MQRGTTYVHQNSYSFSILTLNVLTVVTDFAYLGSAK